jgi:hypothetical protein
MLAWWTMVALGRRWSADAGGEAYDETSAADRWFAIVE